MLHTQFSPVSIIPPVLHTVFPYQYHFTNASYSVFPLSWSFHQCSILSFPLSVSFHQCSLLIFILILLFIRKTGGRSQETPKMQWCFGNRGAWDRKVHQRCFLVRKDEGKAISAILPWLRSLVAGLHGGGPVSVQPIPVIERSKERVFGSPLAWIACSNPAGGMDVCVVCVAQ
jgi:hypothetical protein